LCARRCGKKSALVIFGGSLSLSLFAAPLLPNEELGALTLATSSSTVFFGGIKSTPARTPLQCASSFVGLKKMLPLLSSRVRFLVEIGARQCAAGYKQEQKNY